MSAEICFVNWVSEACRINISRKPLSERISQGRCFRTYVCRHHSHDFSKLSTGFRNPVSQVCPQECHGMSPKSRENVIYKHALRKVWFGYKVSDKARREICITQHVFVMYDRQDLAENVLGKKARMLWLCKNICCNSIALKISLEISATPCCILNRFGHGVFKKRSINKLMSRYCDTKSSSPITATQDFCGELSRHNCFQRALSNYRAVIFFESGYGCMIF